MWQIVVNMPINVYKYVAEVDAIVGIAVIGNNKTLVELANGSNGTRRP